MWSKSSTPHLELIGECKKIASDKKARKAFRDFLVKNPIIQLTVDILLAHMSIAANIDWRIIDDNLRPFSKRGWYLNRWLPTFLIIDGPLGGFIKKHDSPLVMTLKTEYKTYPILAQARDAFNHETFRQVRNGIGHWSFYWTDDFLILEL